MQKKLRGCFACIVWGVYRAWAYRRASDTGASQSFASQGLRVREVQRVKGAEGERCSGGRQGGERAADMDSAS